MAEPVDKVQIGKQESTAGGGDDTDTDPFTVYSPLNPNEDAPEVQGVFLQPPAPSTTSDKNVYVTRDSSGNLVFRDENAQSGVEATLTDLLATGGGGITENEHLDLNTLVHHISENHFEEWTYDAQGRATNVTLYQDATKTTKIRECQVTYNGYLIATATAIQYDESGIEVERLTESATYNGYRLNTVSGVRTP